MAETTADVRRDIELTRERMSTTLSQLEQKLNLMQIVRDHPWPALALAVGAGFLLSGSRADVKAAAAAARATEGTSSKLGSLLDDLAASLIAGVTTAFHDRVDSWVGELKQAIGAPADGDGRVGVTRSGVPRGDGDAATSYAAGAAGAPQGSVDRQLLGVDEATQPGTGRQMLGTDLSAQSGGATRSNPHLTH
jgi:hypothetical protein